MTPLEKLRGHALNFNVVDVSNRLLNNGDFSIWTGSSSAKQHHYGYGGLVQHVLEVTELCDQINFYYGYPVERKNLFLAALYHDAGKLYDYKPIKPGPITKDTEWTVTEHKHRIHHITRSVLLFNEALHSTYNTVGFTEGEEIFHTILAHHGRKEWGSPVEPQTKMAIILHQADMISASLNRLDRTNISDFAPKTPNT